MRELIEKVYGFCFEKGVNGKVIKSPDGEMGRDIAGFRERFFQEFLAKMYFICTGEMKGKTLSSLHEGNKVSFKLYLECPTYRYILMSHEGDARDT